MRQLLQSVVIREELLRAWRDSQPGISGGHEEGGFVLDHDGRHRIVRWTRGEQATIRVPAHVDCRYDGLPIVATFHTHPNTGPDYLQEPSPGDIRAVRDDRELKGEQYLGEIVISIQRLYWITVDGEVHDLGSFRELLGESEP
jgi:proteasome lid subunit RPN8/RPN11